MISDEGLVSLSGLGHLYSMVRSGERAKVAYDFPNFSTAMLPWLSPELLRQVSFFLVLVLLLTYHVLNGNKMELHQDLII